MRLWWRWLAGNPRNKMELIYSYIYICIYTARKSSNFDFFFPTCPSIFWWCMNTFDCYHGHIRSSNVFFPALKHMVVLWFLKSHPFLHPPESAGDPAFLGRPLHLWDGVGRSIAVQLSESFGVVPVDGGESWQYLPPNIKPLPETMVYVIGDETVKYLGDGD